MQSEETKCDVCGRVFEPVYEILVPYVRALGKSKSSGSMMLPRRGAQVGWRCGCDIHSFPESVIEENRVQFESIPRCHDDF